jgi:CheY-like chemotaxis protein
MNLLSNAFKFTSEGEVRLDLKVEGGTRRGAESLAISVTDTGIGIPKDKQKLIFEAFQQADGTTSRKYGGTGLGLSISREIARLLGGELRVESTPGKGSTFTLVVPLAGPKAGVLPRPAVPQLEHLRSDDDPAEAVSMEFADDRDAISPGDRVVLIVEDDSTFGGILLGGARSAGLKGVLANAGSGTLALARKLMPDAITLDLGLADIDGWVLFDLLRHDAKTRTIPIHVISGGETIGALSQKGAASVITKPAEHEQLTQVFETIRDSKVRVQRNVLVADPDPDRRLALVDAIRDGVTAVTAIGRIPANSDPATLAQYHAIVLGFGRSAGENNRIISELTSQFGEAVSKVILFAPNVDMLRAALAKNEELSRVPRAENSAQLASLIGEILPRADGLVGEAEDEEVVDVDATDLAGAKVLIIDDDIRNIYSLTSVLETYGIQVLHSERGRDGIALLEQYPDIDVALVDIMMPELDGYETMREIRRRPHLANLPLISVTAKAMKGDRQKCLEAGASDYIAKPVDLDLLLALLRVWIGRARGRPGAGTGPNLRAVN